MIGSVSTSMYRVGHLASDAGLSPASKSGANRSQPVDWLRSLSLAPTTSGSRCVVFTQLEQVPRP